MGVTKGTVHGRARALSMMIEHSPPSNCFKYMTVCSGDEHIMNLHMFVT